MKRDPFVLGQNYILSGDDIGKARPNRNVMVVGTPGCGKTTSILIPSLARAENSNPILSLPKERDAYAMKAFLESKEYEVDVLNLVNPEKSTVSHDPVLRTTSIRDIENLSATIVNSTIKKSNDDYWEKKGITFLKAIITGTLMTANDDENPGMEDVLKMFSKCIPREKGFSIETDLDEMFQTINKADPGCTCAREYFAITSLATRTASCIIDTVACALSSVFPDSIRQMMKAKPQFDIEGFTKKKKALILITSSEDANVNLFANLVYRDIEKGLIRFANSCPRAELPREVIFYFDDMFCSAPLDGFARDLSLFRSAGMSACLFLQSELQLDAVYKEEAPIIRQNCATYVFFPGGFDDKAADLVSRRMGVPMEEVLFAPYGSVFVMESGSGRKPVQIPRYNTFESVEYEQYLKASSRVDSHCSRV